MVPPSALIIEHHGFAILQWFNILTTAGSLALLVLYQSVFRLTGVWPSGPHVG